MFKKEKENKENPKTNDELLEKSQNLNHLRKIYYWTTRTN